MIKKNRLVFPVLAAIAAVAIFAGCGGSDSSGGDDPASVAPAESPVYVEATFKPEGKLATEVEELVSSVAGIDDVGGEIVSKIESAAAEDGSELDFEKEVEPWLGEKLGMSFQGYDGNDFNGFVVAIQTTNSDEAEEFISDRAGEEDAEEDEYEGSTYFIEEGEEDAVGMIGDFVVVAEDEKSFEAAVDASEGESLAGKADFSDAFDETEPGSIADLFVDIGGLIEQSGGNVDPQAQQFFEATGIKPEEATAVGSLIPSSDRLELDVSSDLAQAEPPKGDASALLRSLPDESVAAAAVPGVGSSLGSIIDTIDENGIPGDIPPNQFKSTMSAAGIDLDKITGSLSDAAVYAVGQDEKSLEGALVLTLSDADQATETVSDVENLIKEAQVSGVTPLPGGATGFEVRSTEIGNKPLVVEAGDGRIAISYGAKQGEVALSSPKGATLGDNAAFTEAVAGLGSTPITGFADGPAAVALIEAMIGPEEKAEFAEAKPYLSKVRYLGIGSEADGDIATAHLVLGLGK